MKLATYHDHFERCAECGHATVGLERPFAINHAEGCSVPREPPRGALPPEVEKATRLISHDVWGEAYKPGEGPMHFAGGTYWHDELLRLADKWERMAAAARVCAGVLPSSDDQRESGGEA